MGGIFYIAVAYMFMAGEALIFKTGTPDMIDYFYGMVFFAGWMFSLFPGVDALWNLLPGDWKESKWVGYLTGVGTSIAVFFYVKNM